MTSSWRAALAQRVASRRLADLTPPLGFPGGPCQVIDRVREEVPSPRLQENLIDDIEHGNSWSNPDAAKVYPSEAERLSSGTRFTRMILGPHVQYRMDLRQVTVPDVQVALKSFFHAYQVGKSQKSPLARRWEEDFARGEPLSWTDPRSGLLVVFAIINQEVKLITTYWEGEPDPRPPGDGGCDT